VKFKTAMRSATALVLACLLAASATGHAGEKKEKPKASSEVDSGSFGVFVRGQRVLTENFIIEQKNGISIIKAELKESAGKDPAIQKSDLEITASGELVRYEWSQPSGSSLTILPNSEFLIEKISASASAKPAEQPFLMPNTTMILDNNFFVHRQVLVWRYLAADCKADGGNLKCQQGPAEFGVVVPQDHTSVRVRMELVGKEKVTLHGAERELLRLNLSGEGFQWTLWVDDQNQFKLMRVAIPADNTEVVRD
jgi:hypothetical protein